MTELCERLVTAVGTVSWQIAAIAVVAVVLSSTLFRRRPHLAAVLWLVVIAKSLTPPLWTNEHNLWSWTARLAPSTESIVARPTEIESSFPTTVAETEPVLDPVRVTQAPPSVVPMATSTADSMIAAPTGPHSKSEVVDGGSGLRSPVPFSWPVAIVAVWFAGIVLGAGLAFSQWIRLRRSLAAAEESPELEHRLSELRQRLGLRRTVRVRLTDEFGPAACGVLRPVIVLPKSLIAALPEGRLDSILVHELTHIRRHDVALGWLQTLAQIVWWFHPAVWFANRRLSRAIEESCDAETVAALNCPAADYARCLVDVMEHQSLARPASAAFGVRPFVATENRVRRVLENRRSAIRHPRALALATFVLTGLLILPGASTPTRAVEPQAVAGGAQPPASRETAPVNPLEGSKPQPSSAVEHRVSRLLSPDGRRIAYGQVAVGPAGDQKVRIIIGNADGSDRKALPVESDGVDEVQWYGNDRIAYVKEHGEDGYFLMDLDGQPAGELRMPAACDSFHQQCLSPDGKKIAFCGNLRGLDQKLNSDALRQYFKDLGYKVETEHGVFVCDLEKQSVVQVLKETVANLPGWSPDSKFLAFGIGQYVRSYPLGIVNVETGELRRPDVKGVGVAWSPDGSRLAMTTDIVSGGSWLGGIPLDGTLGVWDVSQETLKKVSAPGTNDFVKEPSSWDYSGSHTPVWSPDGKSIAYTASQNSKRRKGQPDSSRGETRVVGADGQGDRRILENRVDELAWSADGRSLLWVNKGQFGVVNLDQVRAEVGDTPAVPTGRFVVTGTIRDNQGNPLEGVEVTVARGFGSLHNTEPVKTDAAGRYTVHFGPGVFFEGNGTNLQAASVFASKDGWFESNLCRDGNLGMANFRPDDGSDKEWGFVGIVFPDNPYELDFTMLPAARLSVDLVDGSGQPLRNYSIDLDGDELPPSCSVLRSKKTDERGHVDFEEVPTLTWWMSVGARGAEYRTEPIVVTESRDYHFRLVYDDIAGTLTATATTEPSSSR